MMRRPPRSTLSSSSAASDVYKRQYQRRVRGWSGARMKIGVKFFAAAREATGKDAAEMEVEEGTNTTQLIQEVLPREFPELQVVLECAVLALNEEYCELDSPETLSDGDQIAVIPPISGG
eukprot:TRINITY_DN24103_c0_g1_i7.p2 TRINITY_DN24103_c0_g1~~TRINITY_DN24103_c0_g1_i7.p2  ORF type:complete len:120 (+),score=44.71 TRINITY_DN24103_c0_g1_i7:136-495(+)